MSASMPVEAELTDSQKLFLQAMMWKRICDTNEIKNIYRQSLDVCKVPQPNDISTALYEIVTAINAAIKSVGLSIVKCIDERTAKHHYALISSIDNNISRLSSEYSQAELDLFKKIVECIVYSHGGYITSTEALNLTHTMDKRINKTDAQDTIKKFLRDKWFCQTNKGVLYLSARCIAELDYFLTMSYGDVVSKCHLCQNTVIQAVRCASCKVKIHFHCIRKYLMEQNCCPKCNKEWDEQSGSAEEEEEEEQIIASSTRGRKRAHE